MLRFLRYILEFIAAFVGVVVVLGLLLVWRLNVKPVSSDFLTPYIETGIEGVVPGSKAHLDSTLLTWDGDERAVSVRADNIRVSDANNQEIAVLPSFEAKISVLGLIFGQFIPRDVAIDHLQVKLDRHKDGAFVFGSMAMGGGGQAQSSETVGALIGRVAHHLSRAVLMRKLAITRAVFTIHDDVTQKDWSVSVPEISVTRSLSDESVRGLAYGTLQGRMTVEVTQKDALASVDVQYVYDPEKETHSFSTIFNWVTPAFIAGGHPETLGFGAASIVNLPLTGKIKVTLDRNLSVETAAAAIHGDEGHLVDADLWDQPCPVKAFDLNADYNRDDKKLTISDTHIDFEGPTLDLGVKGMPPTQTGKDLDIALSLKVDNMPMNRYGELWPKPILPDPRYWLAANLRDGTFTHAEVNLNGALAWNDLADISITDGGGKIAAVNGRLTYMDGMPPVEGVSADAVFDLKKMSVKINGGGIGNIRMSPFTVQISGLADPDQAVDIPLQISGPLPEIFRLLDHKPLNYAKALGVSPNDIDGKMEGTVDFHFPLLKTLEMKNVLIQATAKASSVASTKLVPNIAVDQGALALTLDLSGFSLDGQANLNKLPFHIAWRENFSPGAAHPLRHIKVTGSIKDDQWNNFGISSFDGTKGAIGVSLDIVNPDRQRMNVSGDIDMTPASVAFDMIDWKKPANVPATLKFTAHTGEGKPMIVSSLALRGAQITGDGDAVLSPDMSQILSLNFSPLIIGRDNLTLKFSQTFGVDGALRFDADGASLDVGGLRGGKDPDRADPRPKEYHILVDRLYTDVSSEIDKAQISAARDREGWSEIALRGLADGDTPLAMALTPQPDGHRTFTISCDDFGKAMKGLGFTDTIKGGKLSVSGESTVDNPRVVVGQVKISDFSVEKLPVLALLLNATSPFGFSDLLTDSAGFSRFLGDFRWQGDEIALTRAHAAGSAIGINIDGKVDMNTGNANLQGTLVPFSVVNNMLNYIPLIGDILTGGQDQGVLAVSYQIKGALSAPVISVNPVSLLTPGFLRNLFFRDDTAD